jgi:hypothetical protein
MLSFSEAKGAKQMGRLTNLTALDVDTSWYVRISQRSEP